MCQCLNLDLGGGGVGFSDLSLPIRGEALGVKVGEEIGSSNVCFNDLIWLLSVTTNWLFVIADDNNFEI